MKAQNTYLEFEPPLMDNDKLEWLKRRQEGIGGSDAGTCIGENPYKGLYELFIDKTTQPVDEMNEQMYWGSTLEAIIVLEFLKRYGIDFDKVKTSVELISTVHDFMRCNLDGLVTDDPHEGTFIIEAKNVSYHVMDKWGDDFVPEYVYAQCQHNMMVSQTNKCYLVALMGGCKFAIYRVIEDERYCEELFHAEEKFWKEHVLANKCPPPDATSRDAMLRQHPEVTELEYKPDARVDLLIEQIEVYSDKEKAAKGEKESLRNTLALIIGDNEGAQGVMREATWKDSKGRETIDKEALERAHPGSVAKYKKTGKPSRTLRLK